MDDIDLQFKILPYLSIYYKTYFETFSTEYVALQLVKKHLYQIVLAIVV